MKTQDLIEASLIKCAWNKWDTVDLATDFIPGVGLVKGIGKGVWNAAHGRWGQAAGDLAWGAVSAIPGGAAFKGVGTALKATKGLGAAFKGVGTALKATKGLGAAARAGGSVLGSNVAKGVTSPGTREGVKALGSSAVKPLTTTGGAVTAGTVAAGGLAAGGLGQQQDQQQAAFDDKWNTFLQNNQPGQMPAAVQPVQPAQPMMQQMMQQPAAQPMMQQPAQQPGPGGLNALWA